MSQKSLKKNALYSVFKEFFTLFFPLITFPYATRILLPDGIGKINFANSIVSYFVMIAGLGIGSYATREASKVRDDKLALTKLFKEIISINTVCCIFAYLLFFISLCAIPKFSDYRSILLVCSIKIIFSGIWIEWLFSAFEEYKYISIRSICFQILSVIYLFVFVRTKDDIIHYAVFGIILAVGSTLFNFCMIGKYIDIHYRPKLEIKKHLKAIIVFFGIDIVTSIYTMLDTTMLGFLSNDTQVGYYSASTKLGHMILSMITAITRVLLPRLTTFIQKNDKNSFLQLISKSANILILISIPMVFGVIILARPLILVLTGEQYIPAIPSMQIIAPIIFIISLGSLMGGQILPAFGKEKISLISYIGGAVTNVTINAILIPKLGAMGAAIGTVCAESAVTLIQLIYVRRFIFNKEIIISFFEAIFSSTLMALFIYFFLLKLPLPTILILIISFVSGVLIYAACLFIFRNPTFLFYCKKSVRIVVKKD